MASYIMLWRNYSKVIFAMSKGRITRTSMAALAYLTSLACSKVSLFAENTQEFLEVDDFVSHFSPLAINCICPRWPPLASRHVSETFIDKNLELSLPFRATFAGQIHFSSSSSLPTLLKIKSDLRIIFSSRDNRHLMMRHGRDCSESKRPKYDSQICSCFGARGWRTFSPPATTWSRCENCISIAIRI